MSVEEISWDSAPDKQTLFINYAEESPVPEVLVAITTSQDQVKDYLRELRKQPLLSAVDEVELSKGIEAGLFARELLAVRQADDPLEYLEAREERDLAMDPDHKPATSPEEFVRSLSHAIGAAATRLSGVHDNELVELVEKGVQAENQFFKSNLRLVVSIAKRHVGHGLPFMDLIQEGNLGMHHALEKFDYRQGYKFSTYSTWWIRQAITRAQADQSRTVRLPVHMAEQINKLNRIERELLHSQGREATVAEISDSMGVKRERVLELIEYRRQPISMDVPVGDGSGAGRGQSGTYIGDFIDDTTQNTEEDIMRALFRQEISDALCLLKEREAAVMRWRYGIGLERAMTLDEIGNKIGVSRERVRQIEKIAIEKLRKHPSVQALYKER